MAGSENVDTKWLASLLKKSYYEQKPTDAVDFSVTLATAVGENFLSTVYRVKITMLMGSGRRKRFSLIVKNERDGGLVEQVMGSLNLFPIECKVYTVILPMMEELMDEFDDKRNKMWSDCLGYQPYSCIVMDDLGVMMGGFLRTRNRIQALNRMLTQFQGYVSIDRTKWQTVQQGQAVLRDLARFHAMSKILMSRGLINEDDRGHNIFVSDTPSSRRIFPGAMKALSRAILNKWGEEWKEVGQKIANNVDLICDKMVAISVYDKKFEVFNHGDLWSSNIMWKFTEFEGVPFSIKFIDWQFSHISSFIVDVSYFLYSSIVPSIRRANLDLLLDTYQEALEKNLKFFNWEGYVPTKEDMRTELTRVGILSFMFAGCSLPITSTGVSGLSFDVGAVVDMPAEDCFKEEIFTEEKYVREVGPDLKIFSENGVL